MVTFVGAGPGAADLLTLRAVEALRTATSVEPGRGPYAGATEVR